MSLLDQNSAQPRSPQPVIQPQPHPVTQQVAVVQVSGRSYVILQLFTACGLHITYLSADEAAPLGEALQQAAREARTGLTLPTSLTGL